MPTSTICWGRRILTTDLLASRLSSLPPHVSRNGALPIQFLVFSTIGDGVKKRSQFLIKVFPSFHSSRARPSAFQYRQSQPARMPTDSHSLSELSGSRPLAESRYARPESS